MLDDLKDKNNPDIRIVPTIVTDAIARLERTKEICPGSDCLIAQLNLPSSTTDDDKGAELDDFSTFIPVDDEPTAYSEDEIYFSIFGGIVSFGLRDSNYYLSVIDMSLGEENQGGYRVKISPQDFRVIDFKMASEAQARSLTTLSPDDRNSLQRSIEGYLKQLTEVYTDDYIYDELARSEASQLSRSEFFLSDDTNIVIPDAAGPSGSGLLDLRRENPDDDDVI